MKKLHKGFSKPKSVNPKSMLKKQQKSTDKYIKRLISSD